MAKIKMFESFLTGHPEIDNDHRLIVDIVNSLSDAIDDQNKGLCRELGGRFFEFVKGHLEREKEILEGLGYPGLEKHKKAHEDLNRRVLEMKERCDGISEINKPCTCYDSIVTFAVDDIVRQGAEFKSFLKESGFHAEEFN